MVGVHLPRLWKSCGPRLAPDIGRFSIERQRPRWRVVDCDRQRGRSVQVEFHRALSEPILPIRPPLCCRNDRQCARRPTMGVTAQSRRHVLVQARADAIANRPISLRCPAATPGSMSPASARQGSFITSSPASPSARLNDASCGLPQSAGTPGALVPKSREAKLLQAIASKVEADAALAALPGSFWRVTRQISDRGRRKPSLLRAP